MRFAVAGGGRLGASLALALRDAGAELTGFLCATDEGRARASAVLGMQAARDLQDLAAPRPDLFILAVPDGVLPHVASELAAFLPPPADNAVGETLAPPTTELSRAPLVLHTSGATSVSVLADCERSGARILAFHPLQTFSEPTTGSTRFFGSGVAVTPSTGETGTESLEAGFTLAQALGAHPFLLPDDRRELYHAAAAVAANYLVTLEYCAQTLFTLSGMPHEEALSLFLPLATAALDNVGTQGPVAALTGPLSRGDVTTVFAHLDALATYAAHLLPLYRQLGLHTLDLVRVRGEVDPDTIARLAQVLDQ